MATTADLTAALDGLEAATTAETTVDDSAATLLGQLNQLYKDALAQGGTPQEIVDRVTALTAAVGTRTQKMTDAITANTPAA